MVTVVSVHQLAVIPALLMLPSPYPHLNLLRARQRPVNNIYVYTYQNMAFDLWLFIQVKTLNLQVLMRSGK